MISAAQLKLSIYCIEFLAICHAFLEYSHILWETTLLTIVMIDNRSGTRFFQTEAIPPTLWNASGYVLEINFHIMHVARTHNTAAEFVSRIDLKPRRNPRNKERFSKETLKIKMKTKETAPIPITKDAYTFGAIKEDGCIRVE